MKKIAILVLVLALLLSAGAFAQRDYRAEFTNRGMQPYVIARSADVLPILVADGVFILDFPGEKNVFIYINSKDDPDHSYVTILENTVVEEGGAVIELVRELAFGGEVSDADICTYVRMENGTSLMDWTFLIHDTTAEPGNGGEGAENITYYNDSEAFIAAVLDAE